ncbi:MAG TPA: NAD(P)-binding domain-containing protein, partial [Vicinamibacteria bacterium]|nr:NAD(P)-binding domain-containing protein [Vicinamibacteria bacterium]
MNPIQAGLLDNIRTDSARVGTVGLGYVGLPLSVEFASAGLSVTGFELAPEKVQAIERGESYVQDVPSARLLELVRAGRIK